METEKISKIIFHKKHKLHLILNDNDAIEMNIIFYFSRSEVIFYKFR